MNNSISLESQLLEFLREQLIRHSVDLVVCTERKATAIFRALIQEIPEPRLEWDWHNVISTRAMDAFNWDEFDGTVVLLFEELVHHGRNLTRNKERLEPLVPDGVEIVTAGFAVWDACDSRPDEAYFPSVGFKHFEEIREQMILMLQKHGSLLLDTEHIELTARIECSVQEFYGALANAAPKGNAYSFLSGLNRLNLTIEDPYVLDPECLEGLLIPGSTTAGTVKKCRILARSHNTFSIMPIFYPNVRCAQIDDWQSHIPSFVRADCLSAGRPDELFYITGLLASVQLLQSVVSSLSDLVRGQKVILEVSADGFKHLAAMFPNIVLEGLHSYVADVVAHGRSAKLPGSKRSDSVEAIREKGLLNSCYYLLTSLQREIDEELPADEIGLEKCGPHGKSWAEIMAIAESSQELVGLPSPAWTVVPDRLIDNGTLVTRAESVVASDGSVWAVRTFSPDGEIVGEKLRRHLAVRGREWLPVI